MFGLIFRLRYLLCLSNIVDAINFLNFYTSFAD